MTWYARILVLAIYFPAAFSYASVNVPTKYLDRAQTIPVAVKTRFTAQQIRNGDYIAIKNREWKACHQNQLSPYALARDPVASFIEGDLRFKTLTEIENLNLKTGRVPIQPWSGDYWAYASGILAARYMDPEFVYLYDWKKRFDLVNENPAFKIIKDRGQEGVNSLSPAEKYDLLVGDEAGSLTASMWNQGKQYFDEYGNVESWMGICHGWAAAAIVEPRPQKSIEVSSFEGGLQVKLNPSDIKGLVSYSWATNRVRTVTLGSRCNKKDPARDEQGRIKDGECFDLNPSTWHLVVTHMVGLNKRSFVMDATYDYEVWNQPVVGYSYTYFNPETRKSEKQLELATVTRENFTKDPYAKYRAAEARSFVGVSMRVGYVTETMASDAQNDSSQQDAIRWVNYDYDLELDANGNIIGGEWYLDSHPDFVWNPKKGDRPLSSFDKNLPSVSWVDSRLPEEWSKAAHQGSPYGVIINSITEALLKRSASN